MSECQHIDPYTARWNVRLHSGENIAIHLFCRRSSLRNELFASWEFSCKNELISAVVFNFWKLDLHSLRLVSSKGPHVAVNFNIDKSISLGQSLYFVIKINNILSESLPFSFSNESLISIKQRTELMAAPEIKWFFIELTNKCTRTCTWCPSSVMKRSSGIMPYEKVCALLDEIACYKNAHPQFHLDSSVQNPVFLHVMGEPLIHPQFFEIIEYGQKQNIPFCLITNTDTIDCRNSEKLLSTGLETIILSLNSIHNNQAVHQILAFLKMRAKQKCTFPRVLIQVLNGKDILLPDCDLALDSRHVEEQLSFWVDELRSLEAENGIISSNSTFDHFNWPSVLDNHTNDQGTYFSIGKNVYLVFKSACTFGNVILRNGYQVKPVWHGTCRYANAHQTLCVLWDGTCTFCSLDFEGSINLGNIFEQNLDDIWHSKRMQNIRTMMENSFLTEPLCRKCLGTVTRG